MAWVNVNDRITALGHARLAAVVNSDSKLWHELRAGRIGGSDLGAILGVNPWKTPEALLEEKLGLTPPVQPNLAMKLGSYLEDGIRQLVNDENADFFHVWKTGTWISNENERWLANPDGIIEWNDGTLGVLEIKYTSRAWRELPAYYEAQVQWYLHVLGLTKGILVQVHGHNLTEWVVELSDMAQKRLVSAVEAFTPQLGEITHGIQS